MPVIAVMGGTPARCGDGKLFRALCTSGKVSDHYLWRRPRSDLMARKTQIHSLPRRSIPLLLHGVNEKVK